MAELLILVVIAGVVLLYAVDRARKLRARARQMSGMNERLDVAAAKVDEQRERKQARVRASAELTSVLPAIRRPPLTLPGVPGPAAEPEDEPAAAGPEAGPAAEAAADDTPAGAGAGNTADGAGAKESPAGQAAPDAADRPRAQESSATAASAETADEVPPEPARVPEGTLTMGRAVPDTTPTPKLQLTSDGTLIMPSVPDRGRRLRTRPRSLRPHREPGPGPAGPAPVSPAPDSPGPQPRTTQPRTSQPRTSQPRTSQPRTSQPRTSQPGQQSTTQDQANRD